ncbi:heme biosynthesis protein HemY [Phyllobacterium brassicacearum]|uniref:Heme biosynthesis protein HemY n=1 Tax=Phyllobacterium brassicacearum TaxID=314235 RepID=A0A2P7BJD1_9HYPH|nr:heme biosynthesis protein HemY [Phyllobacterium brassicacearum]PSH66577.1 heme biosynthesis protein HemY [Phyllobacterium brassicacearum]TDQ23685.1 HemY protein [Phyllobacterium brassicacearum]
MIRILCFFFVVLLLGAGFAWLADRPGDLVITFAGMQYKVTLMVAASAVVAIVAAVMLTWWIIKSLVASPYALRRHFRARKRDRGYQSLSTGLIAAGAGDGQTARRMIGQAQKLLNVDQEPLIKLLDAQAAMLEGRAEDARAKFEAMLDDPETKLLGLRGLYLEAQRLGARDASRHYAEEAALLAPNVEWASSAALGQKTTHGDWDGALLLLEKQKATKQIDKEKAKRERAALLTAKAMETFDADPMSAKTIAVEANKLAPDLVPAAIIAAKALFQQGDLRKGSKILEYTWKKQPHPEVAETYVHARIGDSAIDRLKRARHLAAMYPHHPESSLAIAHAALAAGELKEAREAAEAVLRTAPRESAYLLLADIEEAQTGDQGRVRQWLSRAVKAPRDPAWTADGYVSDRWAPASPVTGRLNAFEWKVPVEQLGPVIDYRGDFDEALATEPVRSAPPREDLKPLIPAKSVTAETLSKVRLDKEDILDAEVLQLEPRAKASNQAGPKSAQSDGNERIASVLPPFQEQKVDSKQKDEDLAFPVPDDPGVRPEDEAERSGKKFRLF